MLFYIHYSLLTSGMSAASVLLGVYLKAYSDASQGEIGVLLMSFPFTCIVIKPLFCSMADRYQAHKNFMLFSLLVMLLGYLPFSIVPFFPQFYENHARLAWYLLVVSCLVGNGGLGVAWSLGDSLAVNMAQRKKTPYSRMRLMGTVSWGLYGYIIGQINEVPALPRLVPGFLILNVSVILEMILIYCWKNDDFVMYDEQEEIEPPADLKYKMQFDSLRSKGTAALRLQSSSELFREPGCESCSSSMGGTLTLRNARTAIALRDIMFSEDLDKELKNMEKAQEKSATLGRKSPFPTSALWSISKNDKTVLDCEIGNAEATPSEEDSTKQNNKNPQIIIFKMIMREDGRFIKYIILFTLFGIFLSPLNFVFLSLEEVCKERGYNFSQLAGSVLISQAAMETLSFLVLPWFLTRITRSVALATGIVIIGLRFSFYGTYFYTPAVDPYWALIGEWGHGISYGIFCTIMAETALMFSNLTKLFIPELRRLGYLSEMTDENREKIRAEEQAIKMALKATMQAIFGGLMDGLGLGIGSLVCGLVADMYSYISLWQLLAIATASCLILHQLIEITRCRWSDTHRAPKGTKAYEILTLDQTKPDEHLKDPMTKINDVRVDEKCNTSELKIKNLQRAEGC